MSKILEIIIEKNNKINNNNKNMNINKNSNKKEINKITLNNKIKYNIN